MIKEIEPRPFVFDKLLESQKARNELMKWKLIIVSAIGSAGLGLIKSDGVSRLYLIIILIPLVCVYVDVLCRNQSLRSLKINKFTADFPQEYSKSFDIEYHKHYQQQKNSSKMSLESIALIYSTVLITIIVTAVGIFVSPEWVIRGLFVLSGILCLTFSAWVEKRYNIEKEDIINFRKNQTNVSAKAL